MCEMIEGRVRVYRYINGDDNHAYLIQQVIDGHWQQVPVFRTPEAIVRDKEEADGE